MLQADETSQEVLRIWLNGQMIAPPQMIDWILALIRDRDANCRASDLLVQKQQELEQLVHQLMQRDREIHCLTTAIESLGVAVERLATPQETGR